MNRVFDTAEPDLMGDALGGDYCKAGMLVQYTYPANGWSHHQDTARAAGLEQGRVYRISKVEVHDWHTRLWLEGFEPWFNSCHFTEFPD